VGEDEFKEASRLAQLGRTNEAVAAFQRLRKVYPATWIDRRAKERLKEMGSGN
jgi:TolA-binding protein